ncbi:MAG: amidase [Candidatus Rokuibacteriota bacterium]|nr:MAG: amidase [Candidatus Rokubacteria bacterium]
MSRLAEQFERYDGLGLAELIRTKEATPEEVLAATLERIDGRNPAINAVVTRMDDHARAAIRAGLPDGPFKGVPYLLKDLGALYTGVVTSYGSGLFASNVPDHDSEIVARMKRAGLVIVGKSNTPEMGIAPSTEPRLFGPTRNPWNLGHSAGGSSGGAAAAVAAGMLPMAHATDGGGSIRIPASACGLFGLKPTRARNPMGPDAGEGWSGASIGHAVTWSVRDSAALLDATSGPDIGDPYWAPPPARLFLEEVGRDPGRLRIALTTTPWLAGPVDPECAEAVRGAAKLCASLGHHIEEARPQFDEAAWGQASRTIVVASLTFTLETRAAALGRPLSQDDVERITWERVQEARAFSAADYARAIHTVHRTGRAVARFLEQYDILLTPTMAKPPHPLGVLSLSNPDSAAFLAARTASVGFTALFNSSGHPAMSVPLAVSKSGLPLGVQFVARFGDEATLFRLASQLEAAQPWKDRRPPLR